MRVLLNGEPQDITAETLEQALLALGYAEAKIATAVNREFVPAHGRGDFALQPGDQIEVLAPMQGG